jgi:DnaJ-class molecular chaperone
MNEEKIIDEEPCPQCNGTGLYLTDAQARYGDEPQPCSMCKGEDGDDGEKVGE